MARKECGGGECGAPAGTFDPRQRVASEKERWVDRGVIFGNCPDDVFGGADR